MRIKKIILILSIVFIIGFLYQSTIVEAAWWNSSWTRRKNITVNNSQNSNALTDYQIFYNISYDSDMNTSFKDLRFTHSPKTWWNSSWSYRKPIVVNNSGSAQTDYQINITNPIYNETGLVGSWHFSEGSGTSTADSSGNNDAGTITGATWTTGKYGNGLSFDGNDYVSIPDANFNFPAQGALTISAWIYLSSSQSAKGIIGDYDNNAGVMLWIYPQNKLNYDFDASYNVSGGATLPVGQWVHIALTWNGTHYATYLNGTLDLSGSQGSFTDGIDFSIGKYSTSYFNGTIDEVRIYNRSLSASEISALYNAKARLDYADVRFTYYNSTSSTETELNYWMEKDGNFWVKVPYIAAGSNNIYAYYGNSGATSASSGTNTFLFFDDFTGTTVNSSKWNVKNGVSQSNDLRITGSNTWNTNGVTSTYTIDRSSQGKIIEWKQKLSGGTYHDLFGGYSIDPLNYASGLNPYFTSSAFYRYLDGASSNTGLTYTADKWYKIKILLKSGQGYTFWLDSSQGEDNAAWATNNNRIAFNLYRSETTAYIDDVRVRKYSSTEPTTSLGSEETYPETELNYWIEKNVTSSYAETWIKVPEIAANGYETVYMYYGNPSAISASNGDVTFVFFDDFEDNSIDTTKWDYAGRSGTWTETGGQLHGYGAAGYMWNKIPIPADFRIKQKGKTSDAYVSLWALGAGSGNPYVSPWCAAYFSYTNYYNLYYDATTASEAQSFPLDTWYIQEFLVYGKNYTIRGYDSAHVPLGNPDISVTATNKPTGNKISHRTYYYEDTEYIFVAKYVSPEPTTSSGTEEQPGTPPTWQNQGQNASTVQVGGSILLYAQGKDETALDWAWLATNETGSWQNKTGGTWTQTSQADFNAGTFVNATTSNEDVMLANRVINSSMEGDSGTAAWVYEEKAGAAYVSDGGYSSSYSASGSFSYKVLKGTNWVAGDWGCIYQNINVFPNILYNISFKGYQPLALGATGYQFFVVKVNDSVLASIDSVTLGANWWNSSVTFTPTGNVIKLQLCSNDTGTTGGGTTHGTIYWDDIIIQSPKSGNFTSQVYDAGSNQAWQTLDWNGTTPINITNTFGDSSYNWASGQQGYIDWDVTCTAPSSGTLQTVGVYLSTAAGNVRTAIYNSSGNLLGESASIAAVNGWNDLAISGVTITAGSVYRLAFQVSDSSTGIYGLTGQPSGSSRYAAQAYGAFPSALPAGTAYTAIFYVRMNYTSPTNICGQVAVNNTGSWVWSALNCSHPISLTGVTNSQFIKANFILNTSNTSNTPILSDFNITYKTYGPIDMNNAVNTWTWSNFTWQNSSVVQGTNVGWRIYYNNTAGSVNVTDIQTFTVGVATPSVSIQSPLNQTYYVNNMWANATVDQSVDWCKASKNGESNVTMTNSSGNWNYLYQGLTSGSYKITFYCNNSNGMGSSTIYFTLDLKPRYEYVLVNDTTPRSEYNDAVKFSTYWWDYDNDLNYYIFSWNASGADCNTWVNETAAFASTNNTWTNVTKNIPSACGAKKIGWLFYANDTRNQWNSTEINYIVVEKNVTLPAALRNISAIQNNVTFVIATNTTNINSGIGLKISYNITNLDKYCTKNLNNGVCDRIDSNFINLTQLRFYVNDQPFYSTFYRGLYGLETYSSNYNLTVPTNDTPCFDIKAELVYYDKNDDENRIATSNVLQLGTCLTKASADQSCRYGTDCQSNLFCLDSNNDGTLDICKASSTSSAYLCEYRGIGTKERISTDQSCKLAYPGSTNHNIPNNNECIYREDCVSSYCWDTNGDSTTECSASQTSGNSSGIIVSASDKLDCTATACYLRWKCYSTGTQKTIDGQSYTCTNGAWTTPAVPAVVRNISVVQNNITFVIATNTTSFTSGSGLRISYNITNLDKYCTKNMNTGACDQINSNFINLTNLRFYINDKPFYSSFYKGLYGLETYTSNYNITVPTNDTPCFDIKAEAVYYDKNDDENRIATSNVLQLGTCLTKASADQSCRYGTDCQSNLFCLDSNNDNTLDICKSTSTSYGYLCEQYGMGSKERVSTSQSCKLAYPGSTNHNLPDNSECIYREDCASSYCWDTNGDSTTECSASQTSGNSSGIIVSAADKLDCTATACYLRWKCYSAGTQKTIDGQSYTCTNGAWTTPAVPVPEKTIYATFRNITYNITYFAFNSTSLIINATLSNNESFALGLNRSYLYVGDIVNKKEIGVDISSGSSRMDNFSSAKPSSPPAFYEIHVESMITIANKSYVATTDSRCYDVTNNAIYCDQCPVSGSTAGYCSNIAPGTKSGLSCYYGTNACIGRTCDLKNDTDVGSGLCACDGTNCGSGFCYNTTNKLNYTGVDCNPNTGWNYTTMIDLGIPEWRNQGTNDTDNLINSGDAIILSAQGRDNYALDYAILSTNETTVWQNKTAYSSPMDMNDVSNTWTWSNFTWQNSSITSGTIAWRIYYNDSYGNSNATDVMTFRMNTPPSISSASDNSPVVYGNSVIFSVSWSDSEGDQTKIHICKNNSISSQTCTGGSWCDTTSWSATSPTTCSYTTTSSDIGVNVYYAFVCDSGSCSSSVNGTFRVYYSATSGILIGGDMNISGVEIMK